MTQDPTWLHVGLRMVLVYFFVSNTIYVLLLISAARITFRHSKSNPGLHAAPNPISYAVLIPCWNEALNLQTLVTHYQSLTHPPSTLWIVDDGSDDDTLEETKRLQQGAPFLRSLHLPHGGKARAINAALSLIDEPWIIVADADCIPHSQGITSLLDLAQADPLIIAAGGVIRVQIQGWLSRIQEAEYLRAFYAGRVGWTPINCAPLISGAFGLFKRKALLSVGGFRESSKVEDLDVILDLHVAYRKRREPYRIEFLPDMVATTQVPATLRGLYRQRVRWHWGLARALACRIEQCFMPRNGLFLSLLFYLWCFELLSAPIEIVTLSALVAGSLKGWIHWPSWLEMLVVGSCYSASITFGSIWIDETRKDSATPHRSLARTLCVCVIEAFVYRFGHSLTRTWAVLRSPFRLEWKRNPRTPLHDQSSISDGTNKM